MNTHANKTEENKSQSVANGVSNVQSGGESAFQFVDNRAEAVAQRKLSNNSINNIQQIVVQRVSLRLEELKEDTSSIFFDIDLVLERADTQTQEKIEEYVIMLNHYLSETVKLLEDDKDSSISQRKLEEKLKEKLEQLHSIQLTIKEMEIDRSVLQSRGSKQCWYLSIFEGLKRAGLLFPIIYNNGRFNQEKEYDPMGSRPVWQKIFEKGMESNGIDKNMARPKGTTWQGIITDFFEESLPEYQYSAEQYNLFGSSTKKYNELPKTGEMIDGVFVSGDNGLIYFYTVDKPAHAMFYLNKSVRVDDKDGKKKGYIAVYNQQAKETNQEYLSEKINFLIKHTFTIKE